jgi:hypothetical protein
MRKMAINSALIAPVSERVIFSGNSLFIVMNYRVDAADRGGKIFPIKYLTKGSPFRHAIRGKQR